MKTDFFGFTDSEGYPNGWGKTVFSDGTMHLGFWKQGTKQGFGISRDENFFFIGNFEDGNINGLGFYRDLSYPVEQGPVSAVYFQDGKGISSPDFGCEQTGSSGLYSGDMRYFGKLDTNGYAHNWCSLWTPFKNPEYYGEGIYEHGCLKYGLRAWFHSDASTEWEYGAFIRNSDQTGYLLNSTPERPIGHKGHFTVEDDDITLEFYDCGEFSDNNLNGKGTRVYSNGLSIIGYFINGGVARIERVVLPNGEEADPADYTHYLSETQSSEIAWDELSNMSTEEKDAYFADCPILIVPNGVKKIHDYMFYKCENLKGVYFNEDLEEIGKNAFAWCKNLGPVLEIPKSVYRIAESAFSVCNSIRTIYLPNNITVAKWGFMCGVHNVFFETDPPRGVTLDNGAFSDSDMVMSKDMIKKIKAINRRAFK